MWDTTLGQKKRVALVTTVPCFFTFTYYASSLRLPAAEEVTELRRLPWVRPETLYTFFGSIGTDRLGLPSGPFISNIEITKIINGFRTRKYF